MKKHLLALAALAMLGCQDKEETGHTTKAPKDVSGNLNISILLDLSDRISPEKYPNPSMEYYQRDAGYINSIAEAFSAHIKSKKIKQIDDKIQVFFDPAPLNPDINSISKDLKVSLNKENVSKAIIAEVENNYKTEPAELYKLAIKDNNYIGSDTWKFFRNKVNDCTEDDYRNILVILTDGYIFYKNSLMQEGNETSYLTPETVRKNGLNTPNWSTEFRDGHFGFLKANDDLSNLEILVLGINPSPNNPYEEEVIKAYWTKWFETMKVKRYEIRSAELPSDMDKVIKDFILKN